MTRLHRQQYGSWRIRIPFVFAFTERPGCRGGSFLDQSVFYTLVDKDCHVSLRSRQVDLKFRKHRFCYFLAGHGIDPLPNETRSLGKMDCSRVFLCSFSCGYEHINVSQFSEPEIFIGLQGFSFPSVSALTGFYESPGNALYRKCLCECTDI